MKKSLIVLLVVVFALSMVLAGCSNSGTGESASPSSSEAASSSDSSEAPSESAAAGDGEPVTIDIFQFKVEIVDALNAAIEQYKSVAPNVTINLETVGGGADIGPALKAKFASGTGPTIYNIGGPSDVQLYQDKLVDLSNEPWVAEAIPGTLDNATKDGVVYGLPYATEGWGFCINQEIFEAAGVDISTMTSYDSIDAAFAQVQAAIDDGSLADAYPMLEAVVELPGKEAWVLGDHACNLPLGQLFDYNTFSAYEAQTLTFGDTAQGYQDYIDLQVKYTKYADNPSQTLSVDYATEVGGGIALERVACIQQGNWIYGDVAAVDEAVAEKLTFVPAPMKGGVEDSIYVLVPMYWCVNSQADDAQIQAAKDFLNWLYQSDAGKEMIVNDFGFIPPFTNYGDMTPSDPLAQSILAFAGEGKTLNCVFKGAPDGWTTNVMGAAVQGYLGGELTWDQTIAQGEQGWDDARANAPTTGGTASSEETDSSESPEATESPAASESASESPEASESPAESESAA